MPSPSTVNLLLLVSAMCNIGCSTPDGDSETYDEQGQPLAAYAAPTSEQRTSTSESQAITSGSQAMLAGAAPCPNQRFYALMAVPEDPTAIAFQPSDPEDSAISCPAVTDFTVTGPINGTCVYDGPLSESPPEVPGALQVVTPQLPCGTLPQRGGGPPEEKTPSTNFYFPYLETVIVAFETSGLKVRIHPPSGQDITITSGTAGGGYPYTKHVTLLPEDAKLLVDYASNPTGWASFDIN